MNKRMNRFIALLMSLIMIIGMMPGTAQGWSMFGNWFDPTSGKTLEPAKPGSNSDSKAIKLYVGEWTGVTRTGQVSKSSNPTVVGFQNNNNNTFRMQGLAAGFSTITTVTKSDGPWVVTVIQPGISLDRNSVKGVPGDTATVNAKPVSKNEDETVSWSSNDPSVATVSGGVITFVGPGSTTVTASVTVNGNTYSDTVSVKVSNSLKSISTDTESVYLYVGDTGEVNVTGCDPSSYDSRISEMTVVSTKPSVATASISGGKVTVNALTKGSAVLVIALDGVEATVGVVVDQASISAIPSSLELPEGEYATLLVTVNPVSLSDTVTASVSDTTVAAVTWVPEDGVCTVRALKEGTATVTLRLNESVYTAVPVTVTAAEEEETYTVSFLDYDGSILQTYIAAEGATVTVPHIPGWTGHTFSGFLSSDPADTNSYDEGDDYTVPAHNAALTADYTTDDGVVTYTCGNYTYAQASALGTLPAQEHVPYGTAATKPAYGGEKKVSAGSLGDRYYKFLGWKVLGKEDEGYYDFSLPVTENITLVADWDLEHVTITKRTFKGVYGEPIVVEKGQKNVSVNGLTQFTEADTDYYSYYYTNSNGVGKTVFFQFWQVGAAQISGTGYTFPDPVTEDQTVTAVYEPGYPCDNESVNSFYHSTNVYVPVNWVLKSTGELVQSEMRLTNVYPLVGLRTSPVFGLEYPTEAERFSTYYGNPSGYNQDRDDQLGSDDSGTYTCTQDGDLHNVVIHNTAKFGRVDFTSEVGKQLTVGGKTYVVTELDQSRVETVWLCTCLGHTFNGYCLGGTWNALGQVTLYMEEIEPPVPVIRIHYYTMPDGWKESDGYDGAVPDGDEAKVLKKDVVLTWEEFNTRYRGLKSAVRHEWISGREGQLTRGDEEYELNLYYATTSYKLTVNYLKYDPNAADHHGEPMSSTLIGENAAYVKNNLLINESYQKKTPSATGYTADIPSVSGKMPNHDVEYDILYQPVVKINYVALTGGTVTFATEEVAKYDGVAVGSTAVPDTDFELVGWYSDPDCADEDLVSTASRYVPSMPSGGWPDETTYYAKFVNNKKIKVVSPDHTWTYNGDDHTDHGYYVLYGTEQIDAVKDTVTGKYVALLPSGDTVTITPDTGATVKHVDDGTVDNAFSYVLSRADHYSDVEQVVGELKIDPLDVTVTIKGNTSTVPYNGSEQSVTGHQGNYTADNTLYDVSKVTPKTTDTEKASGTNVNTTTGYPMGLTSASYDIAPDTDFTVTLDITDGWLKITPVTTTVEIVSPSNNWDYDGTEHSDDGYYVLYGTTKIDAVKDTGTGKYVATLPTGDKVTITPDAGAKVTDVAEGKVKNAFTYELTNADQYTDVKKTVGELDINPLDVTVTIVGNTNTVVYNGAEQSVTGHQGNYTADSTLYDVSKVTPKTTDTEKASGTNVNTTTGYPMGLTSASYDIAADPNFNVTLDITDGWLKITPVTTTVEIVSPTNNWDYDGTEHSDDGYYVLYGTTRIDAVKDTGTGKYVATLPTGDQVTITPDAGAKVKNVAEGKVANAFTWELTNADQYTDVKKTVGELDINPIDVTVTIKGNTGTVVYNGAEQSVTGHEDNYTASSTLYDVSKVTPKTTDTEKASGTKVNTTTGYPMGLTSASYDIAADPNFNVTLDITDGWLKITPVTTTVEIVSPSNNWDYDGNGHSDDGYYVLYGTTKIDAVKDTLTGKYVATLPTGDQVTITPDAGAKVTDVAEGKVKNAFTWELTNADQYSNVKKTVGELDINPIDVTVTIVGNTATVPYNGSEQSVTGHQGNYTSSSALYDAGRITPKAADTEKASGTAANTTTGYPMGLTSDSYNIPADPNFNVTLDITDGWLKITPDTTPIVITSPDHSWEYDGETHTDNGYTVKYGDQEIPVTKDGSGSYIAVLPTGDTVTVTPDAGAKVTDVADGVTENGFTYKIDNPASYPNVTATAGDLKITPVDVTVTIKGNTDTVPYNGKEQSVTGHQGDYTASNPLYDTSRVTPKAADTEKASGTEVNTGSGYPMGLTSASYDIAADPNFNVTLNVTDGWLKITPDTTPIVITSPDHSWEYDGETHTDDGYTVKYGDQEIPATEDGSGSYVAVLPTGDTVTITPDAGAKVTDVADGMTENSFTYTVTHSDQYTDVTADTGKLEITPVDVTVTILGNTDTVVYDGTEHSVTGHQGTYTADNPLYDTSKVTPKTADTEKASGTEVNSGAGYPMGLTADSYDIASDPNFKVTLDVTDGWLKITPIETPIVITSPDHTWDYDGETHTDDGYTVKYGDEVIPVTEDGSGHYVAELPTGDIITITPDPGAEVTDVSDGTVPNDFTWTVTNPDRYDDITATTGDLKVTPIEVTVTVVGKTATVPYNGSEQSVTGHEGEYRADNPLYDVKNITPKTADTEKASGTAVNTDTGYPMGLTADSYKIAEDPNFKVTLKVTDGWLKITPDETPIVITSPDHTWEYDGETHTDDGYTVKYGDEEIPVRKDDSGHYVAELPTGDIITIVPDPDAEVKDVADGTEKNDFTYTVTGDSSYPDITKDVGDLTVTPADVTVTVTGNTATVVWNGQEQSVTGHKGEYKADNPLYDVKNITPKTADTEKASGTNVNTGAGYPMGLTADSYVITADPNFNVTLKVTDGWLKITPVEKEPEEEIHTITVRYYEEEVGGNELVPPSVVVHKSGDDYYIVTPPVPGYTPDIRIVEGTVEHEDITVDVIYRPVTYPLTVRYINQNGEEIAPAYTDSLRKGDEYSVSSPEIEGYITYTKVVSGTMPGQPKVVTVIYVRPGNGLYIIEDFQTPLGFGNTGLNIGECFE